MSNKLKNILQNNSSQQMQKSIQKILQTKPNYSYGQGQGAQASIPTAQEDLLLLNDILHSCSSPPPSHYQLSIPISYDLLLWTYLLTPNKPFITLNKEKAMAPHSSTLAWKISWTEKPGGLQSMGSQRVRHNWVTSLSLSCIGEGNGNPLQCSCLENRSQGQGSLMGCHLWGRTELDMTEVT